MKVAIVTTDGQTVSQHFGRSPYYKVVTISGGQVVQEEMRERGTGHFARGRRRESHEHHHQNAGHQGHGYGPEADAKHAAMAAEIADCDVLVAGGMGRGAYESFARAGLKVILTDMVKIEDVIQGIINGTIRDLAMSRTD